MPYAALGIVKPKPGGAMLHVQLSRQTCAKQVRHHDVDLWLTTSATVCKLQRVRTIYASEVPDWPVVEEVRFFKISWSRFFYQLAWGGVGIDTLLKLF